jgi:RNA polymerase sigma-70 factor (ECF subfamily)
MMALSSGHRTALDSLVRRFERELFNYLKRYLGDASLADDVFQNTFLQVYLKRDTFDASRRFRPWLYAVATRQAVDALRRGGRRTHVRLEQPEGQAVAESVTSGEADPLDGVVAGESRQKVREAVDGLPNHLRQVVLLAYFQGLKYRDVAEALGIPIGTVKSRLFSAIQLLQERWAGAVGVDSGT